MQDTELYQHLLQVPAPWAVTRVEVHLKQERVDVYVEHTAGARWKCPECQRECGTYDHSESRAWRHLDSCQFKTFLHAEPPRVKCAEHGVRQPRLPWAEPHSRFTEMFEVHAMKALLECDMEGSSRILDASWDECWHLVERAVTRGQKRKVPSTIEHLGVDEKAIAKGHKYLTLVCNLDRGCVEHVAKDRKRAGLEEYYESLSEEQRTGIKGIAMDMWEPFINATLAKIPDAGTKIVFDRFHIMSIMGRAMNSVRQREHRQLQKAGDETLKGTKYLYLFGKENLPERSKARFAELKKRDLKSGKAWAIKENLREMWKCETEEKAREHWESWYGWAIRCALEPVQEAAATLRDHLTNILTYFRHKITTATCEGMNSKIETIKRMARGFRNWQNFKTAILFHCGGLNMAPGTHGNPG